MILDSFNGCQEELITGGASHVEAMSKCLGDRISNTATGGDFSTATGAATEAFSVSDHTLQRKAEAGLVPGHKDAVISVADQLFAEQGDAGPELRKSFLNLFGDMHFTLDAARAAGSANGSVAFSEFGTTRIPPKEDHGQILKKLISAKYEELLDLMFMICEERKKFDAASLTAVNEWRLDLAKQEDLYLHNDEVRHSMQLFMLEEYRSPSIVFSLLYDLYHLEHFRLVDRDSEDDINCGDIQNFGSLNTLTKDSPGANIFIKYWNFANFIAWGQMLQAYEQLLYQISELSNQAGIFSTGVRTVAFQLFEGASRIKIQDLDDQKIINASRLEIFIEELFIEREKISGQSGAQLAGVIASGAAGKQKGN